MLNFPREAIFPLGRVILAQELSACALDLRTSREVKVPAISTGIDFTPGTTDTVYSPMGRGIVTGTDDQSEHLARAQPRIPREQVIAEEFCGQHKAH